MYYIGVLLGEIWLIKVWYTIVYIAGVMIYYCIYCGVMVGDNVLIVYVIGVLLGEIWLIKVWCLVVYIVGVMVGENVVIISIKKGMWLAYLMILL